MKKKLFIVVDVDWFFLSHRLPVALGAMRAGYNVTVIATDTGKAPTIREMGVSFIHYNFLRKSLNPLKEIKIIYHLYKIYKAEKPDIVHHVALKMIMNGVTAAKLARVERVVNAVAGLGHYFVTPSARILSSVLFSPFMWFGRSVNRYHYIFQNDDDRKQFLKRKWTRLKHTTLIKGSGVDLSVFSFSEEPENPTIKVLCATRLLKDKGIYEFAECARLVSNVHKVDVEFILAGQILPINPSAVAASEIQSWENKGWLTWIGFQADMPAILKETHIHVLPSYREGLPKSLIESCAVGRPIVTTNVPGCRDVVDDGVNGFLVPPQNAKALADAVMKLVEDRTLRLSMGKQARIKAEREFEINFVVEKTLLIYKNLLS